MKEVITYAATTLGGFHVTARGSDVVISARNTNETHSHRVTCIAGRIRRSMTIKLNPPYTHAAIEEAAEEKFRSHFGWKPSRVVRSRITSTTIKRVNPG
jgi:hypothetical protein